MLGSTPTWAQDKIKVVATFSILGDLVKNVGGDRIEVATLVGPNGDAHVFSPIARRCQEARRRQSWCSSTASASKAG